jgi:hypothetical protein
MLPVSSCCGSSQSWLTKGMRSKSHTSPPMRAGREAGALTSCAAGRHGQDEQSQPARGTPVGGA